MDEDVDPVVRTYPVASGLLMLVVAAITWVGISLVIRGSVNPLRTVLFAVAFTAVYFGFSYYYADSDGEENDGTDGDERNAERGK